MYKFIIENKMLEIFPFLFFGELINAYYKERYPCKITFFDWIK